MAPKKSQQSPARKKQKTTQRRHPLLYELDWKTVSPLDVFSRLLEENQLSPEVLRKAHETVSAIKAVNKKEVDKNKNNDSTTVIRRRHIALRVYYDGADYSGLAENRGLEADQSVEKQIFAALIKTRLVASRDDCQYSRCGRTDRGVSAVGQVLALKLKSAIRTDATYDQAGEKPVRETDLPPNSHQTLTVWLPPRNKNKTQIRTERSVTEYAYDEILNNLLPPTIRVLGWTAVSDEFSARFSATARTYRYFFVRTQQLRLEPMSEALTLLKGTHDFRNFCKMDVEKVYNFVRKIHDAQICSMQGGVSYFLIHGQAFLWHQIRCIASILFLIGRGVEAPSLVTELLDVEKYPGKPAYPLAPERPLVLHDCVYHASLRFQYSVTNLWRTTAQQEELWRDCILHAARLRNLLQAMESVTIQRSDLERFVAAQTKAEDNAKTSATPTAAMMTWGEALEWLATEHSLYPENHGSGTHTPVLQRSMGTTYEEKVASLQQSARRRERYEMNVVQKRQTPEQDAAFYAKMTKQGSI